MSCKVLNGDYGATITKAFAVDEGVRLAMELELQQIIVESDSAGVVEAINESNCNGEFEMVIQGSLELLQSFRSWNVRYLKRNYNRAVHKLAQFAKIAGSTQQWKGVEPPMLQYVLLGPKFDYVFVCSFFPCCCVLLYSSFSLLKCQVQFFLKKNTTFMHFSILSNVL